MNKQISEQQRRASLTAFIPMVVLVIILLVFSLFNGLPTKNYLALLLGFVGFQNISLFITNRKKLTLFVSVVMLAAAVIFLVLYIIQMS